MDQLGIKNKAKDITEAKLEQTISTFLITNHFRYGHRKTVQKIM